MACGDINQTSEKSLQSYLDAKSKGTATTGTGVFIIPDPQTGVMEFQSVVIENIEYEECVKRGYRCIAFKWIHVSLGTLQDLRKQQAQGKCGHVCLISSDCQPGCWCNNRQCVPW